ncbi:MAG: hypothetical protein QOH95_2686 [Gaiellaceae bacterium]|jgi:hypothetical protein|nr:hypothetical protein [Gaiellaceae bacterium]
MTSTRLVLAAGSIAATLAGIVPMLPHDATAAASPLRVGAAGVAVSVQQLPGGKTAGVTLVVPKGASALSGAATGSTALAARSRLTVTRSADGATLFTGSLATFRTLPVVAGSSLVVRVQKPTGFGGLRAGALLNWS